MTAYNQLHNRNYQRRNSADRAIAPKRQQIAAPELSRSQFRYEGNGNYRPIIEGALCQFTVKAYAPGRYWRVFYQGPDDLTAVELERRYPFATPAQVMWLEMATAAHNQRIEADRANSADVDSPAPTEHCPDGATPF